MDANDQKKVEDEFRVNEEQLRLLGMGEEQLKELSSTRRTSRYINLVAPGDGIVLSRSISPRQRFEKGTELYRIANLRKVWIFADVHGEDGRVGPGTRAEVSIPELGETIEARVASRPVRRCSPTPERAQPFRFLRSPPLVRASP